MSGLIYAVIVAAWAGVLVPRWLRRNEEIDQAREADAARGVRVLERRDPGYRLSHNPTRQPGSTVFRGAGSSSEDAAGGALGVSDDAGARAQPSGQPSAQPNRRQGNQPSSAPIVVKPDDEYIAAARRRLKVFVFLITVTAAMGVAAAMAVVPVWAPAPTGVLMLTFLVAARRAAVAQMYRQRHQMRVAARTVERDVDEEVEDDAAPRIAVFDVPEPEPVDPDAWSPVDVPLPTYMTKPAVRRLARTIDLSAAGSWTSGRLDPASAIEVPGQRSADAKEASPDHAEAEELEELSGRRRAVGD